MEYSMQDLSRYKKKDHVQIQTKYVSLLAFGSVAVLGLMFALGLLVGGRGHKQAACPSADPLEALDAKSGEPKPPVGDEAKELKTFRETLTQPADNAVTPASLLPTAANPENAAAEAIAEAAFDERLERPRHTESLVPEEIRDNEPGSYSLQVDSFRDRREASVLVSKLAKAGHKAFLVSVDNPERGGQWFRVRIGPFATKIEAWKYKRAFEEKERMATFVVKRRDGDV
jgi:cell division septation protein DedD